MVGFGECDNLKLVAYELGSQVLLSRSNELVFKILRRALEFVTSSHFVTLSSSHGVTHIANL